jgi:hypothetical protein
MYSRKVKGMRDEAIHKHMRDLRILFMASMRHYNNPQIDDAGMPYSPFDIYKNHRYARNKKEKSHHRTN